MNTQVKACPKCQSITELDQMECAKCGHKFRTVFVHPDKTQMVGTITAIQATQVMSLTSSVDETERATSLWWYSVGLFVATVLFGFLAIRCAQDFTNEQNDRAVGELLGCILLPPLASFFVLRIRRLCQYKASWCAIVLTTVLLGVTTVAVPHIAFGAKEKAKSATITFEPVSHDTPPTPILQPASPSPVDAVKPGMSMDQVQREMGIPDRKSAYPNGECWYYTTTNSEMRACFDNGLVREVYSTKRSQY